MFEKVGQIAEQGATSVSRRQFLGRFGGGALALATAVGGFLALPAVAHARGRACSGPLTSAVCVGKNGGDLCSAGFLSGKCRNNGNSFDCYCAIKSPPH